MPLEKFFEKYVVTTIDLFGGMPYKSPCLNAEGEEGRESRGSYSTPTIVTIIAALANDVKLNVARMK